MMIQKNVQPTMNAAWGLGIQTQSSYREPAHCAQSANFDQVIVVASSNMRY